MTYAFDRVVTVKHSTSVNSSVMRIFYKRQVRKKQAHKEVLRRPMISMAYRNRSSFYSTIRLDICENGYNNERTRINETSGLAKSNR